MKKISIAKFLIVGVFGGLSFYLTTLPLEKVLSGVVIPYLGASLPNMISLGVAIVITFVVTLALFGKVPTPAIPGMDHIRKGDLHEKTPIQTPSVPAAAPVSPGTAEATQALPSKDALVKDILGEGQDSFVGGPVAAPPPKEDAQVKPEVAAPADAKPAPSFPVDTQAIAEAKQKAQAMIDQAIASGITLVNETVAAEEKRIAEEAAARRAQAEQASPQTTPRASPLSLEERLRHFDDGMLEMRRMKAEIDIQIIDQEVEARRKAQNA